MAKSTKKKQSKRPDHGRASKSDRRSEIDAIGLPRPAAPLALGPSAVVLDRLYEVVMDRRTADPSASHSARLLSRGLEKVAQKFGEEAIECLIEGAAGNHDAVVAESADVLYHLIVLWVANRVRPEEVWRELRRREGISGIAEKASRARDLPYANGLATTKIP
jgi:phosphoribosyl-ATP pyrophosphohydrolase